MKLIEGEVVSNYTFSDYLEQHSGSYSERISEGESFEVGFQRYVRSDNDYFEETITVTPSPHKNKFLIDGINCGDACFHVSIINTGNKVLHRPSFSLQSELPVYFQRNRDNFDILDYADDHVCLDANYNRCPIRIKSNYNLIPQGYIELELCQNARLKSEIPSFESEHLYAGVYGDRNLSILEIPKESEFKNPQIKLLMNGEQLKEIKVIFYEKTAGQRCENELH